MKSVNLFILLIIAVVVVQPLHFMNALPREQWRSIRPESSGRIISGQPATRGQFPHQVGVSIENYYSFGAGSLISPIWVLTAGHVVAPYTFWTLFIGAQNLSASEPGTVTVSSTTMFHHPGFELMLKNGSTYLLRAIVHDIGLIQLPEPLQFTEFIKPVKLPTLSQELDSFVGRKVLISGWGMIADHMNITSDVLNYVELTVISNYNCWNRNMAPLIGGNQICAAGETIENVCGGDSGGALVLVDGPGDYTQIGIASFVSVNGCEGGDPAAFTRVTGYLAWIEDVTGIAIVP